MFNQIMANQSISGNDSGPILTDKNHGGSDSLMRLGASNISLLALLVSWIFM
jgi:hypothetical protein